MPKPNTSKKICKSEVHVAINDPSTLRRYILESAKEAIGFLQKHEKIESIRKEKQEFYQELQVTLKELSSLTSKLDRCVPKVKFDRDAINKEIRDEGEMFKEAKIEKTAIVPKSRVDRLEEEVSSIEAKINSLK